MGFLGGHEFQCATCRHCARLDRDGVICRFGSRETFKGSVHIALCTDHEPTDRERARRARRRRSLPIPRFASPAVVIPLAVIGSLLALAVGVRWIAARAGVTADDAQRSFDVRVDLDGRTQALAFADGARALRWKTPVTMRVVPVAELVLPTGRLAAGDATGPWLADFDVTLPAGRHGVLLGLARAEDGAETLAFAGVRFSDAEVVSWRAAMVPYSEAHPQPLEWPLDSGTGAFLDWSTTVELARSAPQEGFRAALDAALAAGSKSGPRWADLRVVDATGANLIAFGASREGAAFIPCFGFDAGGEPAAFVADLQVVRPAE